MDQVKNPVNCWCPMVGAATTEGSIREQPMTCSILSIRWKWHYNQFQAPCNWLKFSTFFI